MLSYDSDLYYINQKVQIKQLKLVVYLIGDKKDAKLILTFNTSFSKLYFANARKSHFLGNGLSE